MAKLRGVKFGRPAISIPHGFEKIAKLYNEKKITSLETIKLSGLYHGTFYRKINLNMSSQHS